MSYPMPYGRPHYYDFRAQPPASFHHSGYHAAGEYQRSRPAKLAPRVLNRRFKKVTIQLNDQKVLVLSVQVGKLKLPHLVFSQCEGSFENKTDTVSVPEPLVVPFIQQLHKLSKWRPSTSSSLPSGQALAFEEAVFRSQIVSLSDESTPPDARLHAVKIYAETRAKDPQERKEISRVLIPLDTNHLMKVKEAMNDALVAGADSPLYHTSTHHGTDGSKFYLDLIKESGCHYLKISQVTRDFRSILHVPAEDLEAIKTHLESCLKAVKGEEEQKAKKKKSRASRRRQRRSEPKQAGSDKENKEKVDEEKEDSASDKKTEDKQDKQEKEDKSEEAEKKDASEKADEKDKKEELQDMKEEQQQQQQEDKKEEQQQQEDKKEEQQQQEDKKEEQQQQQQQQQHDKKDEQQQQQQQEEGKKDEQQQQQQQQQDEGKKDDEQGKQEDKEKPQQEGCQAETPKADESAPAAESQAADADKEKSSPQQEDGQA